MKYFYSCTYGDDNVGYSGIIIHYELWLRGLPGSAPGGDVNKREPPEQRVFHAAGRYDPVLSDPDSDVPAPATSYTIIDLQPYTVYELRVLSENSLGKAPSDWVRVRTAESGKQSLRARSD